MQLNSTSILSLALTTMLSLSGCGQDSDPLVGSWSNGTCYGTDAIPEGIEECSVTLTFTDALDIELTAEWLSMPATADFPGCTTTETVTGQTWSTESGDATETLTVSGSGSAALERTGCVNEADNVSPTSTTGISIPNGEAKYEISGTTLTVLDTSLEGAYER